MIEWSTHFLDSYRAAQLPTTSRTRSQVTCWIAPPRRTVKINFDVGFLEEDKYQVAVVARDDEGLCLWWRIRRFVGQPPVVVGEARAALEGARMAMDKNWRTVILEGDNS